MLVCFVFYYTHTTGLNEASGNRCVGAQERSGDGYGGEQELLQGRRERVGTWQGNKREDVRTGNFDSSTRSQQDLKQSVRR